MATSTNKLSNTTDTSTELNDTSSDSLKKSSNSYSMDRIRLESIEKRKQECAQIIKERKRKLSELYCVARLPFVPISGDHVQHIEDKLMAFLEKNDLENGHIFDISFLSKEKIFRKSSSPQSQQNSSSLQRRSSSEAQRPSSQSIEPSRKLRKIDSDKNKKNPATIDNSKTNISVQNNKQKNIQTKQMIQQPKDKHFLSHNEIQEQRPTVQSLPASTSNRKISPIPPLIDQKVVADESVQVDPSEQKVIETAVKEQVKIIENVETKNILDDKIADDGVQLGKDLVDSDDNTSQKEQKINEQRTSIEADEVLKLESTEDDSNDNKSASEGKAEEPVETIVVKDVRKSSEVIDHTESVSQSLPNHESENIENNKKSDESNTDIATIDKTKEIKPNDIPIESSIIQTSGILEDENYIPSISYDDPNEPLSLLESIKKYAADVSPKRADEHSDRDLPYRDIDIKKLMITLMPERKPHKVAEARSLTELYYHQQTLQLQRLLLKAHKTLTTDAFETSLVEGKVSVLHSRIEELKRKHSWSLRQPRKQIDPFLKYGRKTHWDNLMSEAKWLSTDFREFRRYQLAQCVFIAQAVHDYWTYGKVCCIKRSKINFLSGEPHENNEDSSRTEAPTEKCTSETGSNKMDIDQPEQEDVESLETIKETSKDIEMPDASENPESPVAVEESFFKYEPSEEPVKNLPNFTYPEYEKDISNRFTPFKVYSDFESFPATDKSILNNLPFYLPFDTKESDHIIDKQLYGHVSTMLPPQDEEAEFEKVIFRRIEDSEKKSFRCQNGLFGSYRRINILKPPRPPSIKHLNIRIPTIWLPHDDKYLIKYVSEFSFNWDVIAAHLSAKPTRSYTSNIERRTPWQCFERYIQLNDKFQFSDMRGMNAMAAKEWLEAAHQVQATTKRRISPLGVGGESIQRGNRKLRWASMFDAMRKLMKKRELLQKPPSQPRKIQSEVKKTDTPTPEYLSKLKSDRDRSLQESYAQQGRSVAYQRMRGQNMTRQLSSENRRLESKNTPAASPQPTSSQNAQNLVQGMQNGTNSNNTQFTPEQVKKFLQIQKQRQLAQRQKSTQQQQQLQPQQKKASDSLQSSSSPNFVQHQSAGNGMQIGSSDILTQPAQSSHSSLVPTPEQVLQGASGITSVSPASNINAELQRQSSPKGIKPQAKPKFALSHAQISHIINRIQQQNPTLDNSQVTKLASSYISKLQHAKQLQYEKQQQQQQQQGTKLSSQAVSSPSPLQMNKTTGNSSQYPEKKNHVLTSEQFNSLMKSPKITEQQRKHLLSIRNKQIETQRILQAQAQAQRQIHSQIQSKSQSQSQPQSQSQSPLQMQAQLQAQLQNRSDSNSSNNNSKLNSSSITTRFSPQAGSSNVNTMKFFDKNAKNKNRNIEGSEQQVNNLGDADFSDLSKIDEMFGLSNTGSNSTSSNSGGTSNSDNGASFGNGLI